MTLMEGAACSSKLQVIDWPCGGVKKEKDNYVFVLNQHILSVLCMGISLHLAKLADRIVRERLLRVQ